MKCEVESRAHLVRGMTLIELMIGLGLGSLVLGVVATLYMTSIVNFAGLSNYAQLTGQSRLSLDRISRDVREATQIVSCNTNLPVKTLTLTNAIEGIGTTYTWDSTTGVLTSSQTGQPDVTCLTGCSAWEFDFYQRTPNNDWTFYPTTDLNLCKLINMTWKCSRSLIRAKANTETMVTAQIVLRNKP